MKTKSDFERLDGNQRRAIQEYINGDDYSLREEVLRMEETIEKLKKAYNDGGQLWLQGMILHYVQRLGILCCLASRVKQGLTEGIFNGSFYATSIREAVGSSSIPSKLGTKPGRNLRPSASSNTQKGKGSNDKGNKISRRAIPSQNKSSGATRKGRKETTDSCRKSSRRKRAK